MEYALGRIMVSGLCRQLVYRQTTRKRSDNFCREGHRLCVGYVWRVLLWHGHDTRFYRQWNVTNGTDNAKGICVWLHHQYHLALFRYGNNDYWPRHPQPYHSGMWTFSRSRRILWCITFPRSYTALCDGSRGFDWPNCARCGHFHSKPEIRRTCPCSSH